MSHFRNWTRSHECNATVFRPTDPEALATVVRRQAGRGEVRIAGSGMAHGPLVSSSTEIVSTSALRRVLAFEPDGTAPFVEVEAGMTVAELTAVAAAHGLVARQRPVFTKISVGGLLSTGSHGVGLEAGCFADGVLAITCVDARGRSVTIERADPRFDAATSALGGFGVIYSVKIGLVRDASVRMTIRRARSTIVLGELEDLVASHEGVELFWNHPSDHITVITFDTTDSPTNDRPFSPLMQQLAEVGCAIAGDYVLPAIQARSGRAALWFCNASMNVSIGERTKIYRTSDAYHFVPAIPRSHHDMSFAVPTARAKDAFTMLVSRVRAEAREGRTPLTYGLHARFVGPARPFLAPGHGNPTCHIDLATAGSTRGAMAFYAQIEDEVLEAFPEARLHWGKLHFQIERIARRYPKLASYREARQAFDPDGVFVSPHLVRVLGREAVAQEITS